MRFGAPECSDILHLELGGTPQKQRTLSMVCAGCNLLEDWLRPAMDRGCMGILGSCSRLLCASIAVSEVLAQLTSEIGDPDILWTSFYLGGEQGDITFPG